MKDKPSPIYFEANNSKTVTFSFCVFQYYGIVLASLLYLHLFRWNFIKQLNLLQNEEGLHSANKLRNSHLEWKKQKMKVSIAAQTISSSVADSLDFCREDLKLEMFEGSEPTSRFIRLIDSLFDVFNSRNLLAKGHKAPMQEKNESSWQDLFSSALDYLSKLTDMSGKKLINSPRKTAFIGLIINIHSFRFLFENLIKTKQMRFLLTYKASQDHVELFFCALRSRLGANNNPSSREFKYTYKRLLLHHQIKGDRGNSIAQDDTSILHFKQEKQKKLPIVQNDFSLERKYGLAVKDDEHDYSLISYLPVLTEFQSSVVDYISGFTVRMALKLLNCTTCAIAILEPSSDELPLVKRKDRGGLLHVSENVRIICKTAETTVQKMLKISLGKLPSTENLSFALTSSVLKNVFENHN